MDGRGIRPTPARCAHLRIEMQAGTSGPMFRPAPESRRNATPGTGASSQQPAWRSGWLWGLLLVVTVFIAYQRVRHAGFIWDDDAHLTRNPCIVGPLGFSAIWTSSKAVYYPLVLTSFWIEHALWGLNPLPYHMVNVAMHAASALLLWLLLRRLNVPGAWLGAAIWALHPVQVESVAWITELKNTQSCVFYLLAILFFLRWIEASGAAQAFEASGAPQPPGFPRARNYALALLCATLAILSKSSTVMLPVVLGLCWWWMDPPWRWRNACWLTPFAMVSAAAGAWTVWEQKYANHATGAEWSQTWPQRALIAGKDIWFYLGKLLWPHPLTFIYRVWNTDTSRLTAFLPLAAAACASSSFGWRAMARFARSSSRPLTSRSPSFRSSAFSTSISSGTPSWAITSSTWPASARSRWPARPSHRPPGVPERRNGSFTRSRRERCSSSWAR